MRKLLLHLLLLAALSTAQAVPPPTYHYCIKYALSGLDLKQYPLFVSDGQAVYFASTQIIVFYGQFATLADCQAFVPPVNPGFVFFYTDPTSGMQMSIEFVSGQNGFLATNQGCGDRNFQ